ncbi:MAG: LacI family transcriptional regulator [Arcticibacterium sp.]
MHKKGFLEYSLLLIELTTILLMKKEITIYDIADQLNISPSTVSRALNDHPAINERTKERINKMALEMGYRSNLFAKNLQAQSTMTIGVIVPKLDSYFMATVLAGMEKEASKAGYNLLITQSLESLAKEIANAGTMFKQRVDGLLVSTTVGSEKVTHFDPFLAKGVPTLFFDGVFDFGKAPKIVIDNEKAGYEATKHLIEQDCKSIYHITGEIKRKVYHDRFHGYLKALKEYDLPFNEDMLFVDSLSIDRSYELSQYLHKATLKPDGVFVTNDSCAASLMTGLKKMGYRVPEDIAIIGFNDDPITRIVEPKLSTIHYPGEEMGEIAAKSLISHLNKDLDFEMTNKIILRHDLIVRDSTRKK